MMAARVVARRGKQTTAKLAAAARQYHRAASGTTLAATVVAGGHTTRGVQQEQRRDMSFQYKAPLRDIKFVSQELLEMPAHYEKIGNTDCSPDMVESILEASADFAENELSPINRQGDIEGCTLKNGQVYTPKGFKEAYANYIAGGWAGLTVPEEYGGQGLPLSLGMIRAEMIGTANWSWGMYPGLSSGAMNTLLLHGSEDQKQQYLTKLASGVWTGTMCLTEPHCGTDLGQGKTKAVRQADGTFKLTGTKIFISAGDHDMAENIIHIVLAKIDGPDTPEGVKGISLFLVPKYLPNQDGTLSDTRNINVGGIEKKMGIKGSATCTMNFDESKGFLIGKEHTGLYQMFTFMNTARIGTACQGVTACEYAFQGALPYARDRMAMRALSGTKCPEKPADPIMVHGDVRRMLLTTKAFAEGGRALLYDLAKMGDYMVIYKTKEERDRLDKGKMGLLTPIGKGFLTEIGVECASHGMQVYGGHGFISEWGMEQNLRDTRIATMYEGTTGIQALDLIGRKILLAKFGALPAYTAEIVAYCANNIVDYKNKTNHKRAALTLSKYAVNWLALAGRIAFEGNKNRDAINAHAVDFMMHGGYVALGFYWLKMMDIAAKKLAADPFGDDALFYRGKIQTGEFYFAKLLPRALTHASCIKAGAAPTMTIKDNEFGNVQ